MAKRTISAGVIGLFTYSILYYSGIPAVIQAAAAALCCFCLYELACATDAIKNEALFTLSLLAAAFFSFWQLPQEAAAAGICLAVSIPVFTLMMIFQPRVKLDKPWCFVLLAVLVSFVIFNADSLGMAARDLRGMFCLGTLPLVTTESLYYFRSFAVLFLVGLLGATPLPKRMGQKLRWLEIPAMVGLLVLCTAYLVDGSFNPFLYFRF